MAKKLVMSEVKPLDVSFSGNCFLLGRYESSLQNHVVK